MHEQPAVLVMVKAPIPGQVKTRLVPPLTAEEAAELAACFARDTVALARRIVEDVIIAYAPAHGRGALERLLPAGLTWIEQPAGDLGRRQDTVLAEAAGRGFGPLLMIGTDCPLLRAEALGEALDVLRSGSADVAVGPAEDGGYWVLGVTRPQPGLLDGVDWSTERVLGQVLGNAEALGLRVHSLPAGHDVDTPADLRRLEAELLRDPAAEARAPVTARWLRERRG